MISIAVIEDNRVMREALAHLLGEDPGFRVVHAEAVSDVAAIQRAEPGVLLLDVDVLVRRKPEMDDDVRLTLPPQPSPSWCDHAASCSREWSVSFSMMLRTWLFTVCFEMCRRDAPERLLELLEGGVGQRRHGTFRLRRSDRRTPIDAACPDDVPRVYDDAHARISQSGKAGSRTVPRQER